MQIDTSISKKTIVIIISALSIFVAIILVIKIFFKAPTAQAPSETKKSEELKVIEPQIEKAKDGESTESFPADLPLNKKTEITESYSATYPDSTAKQSTVVFKSSETPEENFSFYMKWAQDNEWEITNQSDEENSKSLYIKKDNKEANITINNELTNISYVEF